MRLDRYCLLIAIALWLLPFTSCEKPESVIVKPQPGPAQISRIDMGEDYGNQVFFNFETGSAVLTSKVNSWDLAFEAAPDGYHVFMNGAKDLLIYNTHTTSFSSVTAGHALVLDEKDWGFDAPSGMPDSTCIGEWKLASGLSRNEIYIIRFDETTFAKFFISAVTDTSYTFHFGDIGSNSFNTMTVPKDPAYNYAYFSFENGGKIVHPEPPRNSWDIVFTRYRYIYYDLNNLRYVVSGVLLNPYNTTAIADSITGFQNILYDNVLLGKTFSSNRDVIGFDWKKLTGSFSYVVDQQKCYVVHTRNKQYWKLHFLDFYDTNGLKGSPTFEFERLH